MSARVRVGVLASGRGSNLQALLEAAADPGYPAGIALVVSDRPGAGALARAGAAGVPAVTVDRRAFADRAAFEAEIDRELRAHRCRLVCLAGFMRVLGPAFVAAWEGRMLNIHPSLLPAFPGLDTHRRAIEARVRVSGCSVHFVTAELDAGPVAGRAEVPVLPSDTPETLAARVLEAEHRLYPAVLRLLAEGRIDPRDGSARDGGAPGPGTERDSGLGGGAPGGVYSRRRES